MGPDEKASASELSEREARFLSRLAQKYEKDEKTGIVRSLLIAAAAFLALFAAARWIPQWYVALIAVEAAGLVVFYQYKRFARFRTRVLLKLWRERAAA